MLAAVIRFSVRHAGLTVALAFALLGYGVTRLLGAQLDVFPEFSPTQVVIQSEAPGYSAAWVESLVTQPIEQAIGGLEGLQSLRSQSIPGLSVVTVLFVDGTDLHRHRQNVAERLAQTVGRLPPGVTPNLTPLTSSASTVLGLGLTSRTLDAVALRTLVERTLRPQLMATPGVADVNVFGGELAQWQIRVDPQRLAQAGLGFGELAAAAREATGVRAAGFVESANQRLALGVEAPGGDAAALARAVVAPPRATSAPTRATPRGRSTARWRRSGRRCSARAPSCTATCSARRASSRPRSATCSATSRSAPCWWWRCCSASSTTCAPRWSRRWRSRCR